MNAKLAAAIETAWSAMVVGAIAVVFRHEITRVLTRARAEMDERTRAIADEAKRNADGLGYLAAIRETLIAEENDCGCNDA